MTIDLKNPIKRKVLIGNRAYIVSINKLGIMFREKGSRDVGLFLSWEKALMVVNGLSIKDSSIRMNKRTGKTEVKRGLL